MKRIKYIILFSLFFFLYGTASFAQDVVLSDEFDNGDGKWNTGWIDAGTTSVAVSIDNTGKLSGANSYKIAITNGGVEMWRVQRLSNLPLIAGNQYTVSFMAVSNVDNAGINVLFEINGDPYTKRLDDTATVTTVPQTFTYTMTATEDVANNQLKFMLGSQRNSGKTIWIDKIVVTRMADPTIISQWGRTTDGYGNGWPILNTAETTPGNASIGGYRPMNAGSNGASLRGGFSQSLQPTTEEAVVVRGKMEFAGGDPGSVYTALRFAITYQDSATLQNQNTDTAKWVSSKKYFGYEITPRSGTTDYPNGGGGAGPVWTIKNGNWASTYSNGGGPIGPLVYQAPRNAIITEGTYDWAVSVKQVNDTTSEVRWYVVKSDNKYWFGGSVLAPKVTDKFNNIAFWTKEGEHTQFNILDAKVDLGDPIEVPEAPFEKYYLEQWGRTSEGYGNGWPILNDSDYVSGNASIGGYRPMNAGSNGASVRGYFGQNVNIPTNKAVIVKGKMEFAGGDPGSVYTALRFAITFQDSATLQYQYTDTAKWVSTKKYFGYEITPRSGTTDYPNGGGGAGPIWTVNNGNWASTYSNGGGPIGPLVYQAPRNAVITQGTYDWAISVQQVNDTTNEVRWYMVKTDNKYWFGGTVLAPAVTNKLNNIAFWTKEGEHTQFNILDAEIDLGAPITVPEAPWEDYYVDTWGFNGGTGGWDLIPDPDQIVGNVSIEGSAAASGLVTLRGGFGEAVTPKVDPNKALIVEGKFELVGGGFEAANSLRLGLFYSDSAKVVKDSAWTGTDNYSKGYLVIPRSGTNALPKWGSSAVDGTAGAVVNGKWSDFANASNYSLGNLVQRPSGATGSAGLYNFQISVQPKADGKNDVRYLVEKDDKSYAFGGVLLDSHSPLATTKYNGICFALNGSTATALKLTDVIIKQGAPLDSAVVTDVEQQNTAIPIEYALDQNYPNPFNPTTTINFALPKAGNVSLVVYDILGKVVTKLVDGNYNAGYYKVNFNASNLTSGVYFYSITAGDFNSVKKLMLIK